MTQLEQYGYMIGYLSKQSEVAQKPAPVAPPPNNGPAKTIPFARGAGPNEGDFYREQMRRQVQRARPPEKPLYEPGELEAGARKAVGIPDPNAKPPAYQF